MNILAPSPLRPRWACGSYRVGRMAAVVPGTDPASDHFHMGKCTLESKRHRLHVLSSRNVVLKKSVHT